MSRIAQFDISMELIVQALAMPDDMQILDIWAHPNIPKAFTFLVEHDEFPEVPMGEEATKASPLFTADYEKRPSTWITIDWRLTDE